jgi:hypothetical protein
MKHLKTYESEVDNDFKFNIGDVVICIKNTWPIENMKLGETYIVLDRKKYSGINYYGVSDTDGYGIESILIPDELAFYGEKIFVTPLEYNADKYNI